MPPLVMHPQLQKRKQKAFSYSFFEPDYSFLQCVTCKRGSRLGSCQKTRSIVRGLLKGWERLLRKVPLTTVASAQTDEREGRRNALEGSVGDYGVDGKIILVTMMESHF